MVSRIIIAFIVVMALLAMFNRADTEGDNRALHERIVKRAAARNALYEGLERVGCEMTACDRIGPRDELKQPGSTK